jgi:hypothetical protein
VPALPKLDFRIEGVYSDPSYTRSNGGIFMYWEAVQTQGYTNKGNIMGDWIGREAKGGQSWLTWHLTTDEWIQLNYRYAKAAKDFIPGAPNPTNPHLVPGGTTQHDVTLQVVKRIGSELEINGWLQYERWNVPLLRSGEQSDTSTAVQLTWHPHKVEKSF